MNLATQQSRVLELVQTLNEAQLAYLLRVIQSSLTQISSSAIRETRLDFVDCILAAYSVTSNKQILSFDKKLNNFIARKLSESND